jgi:hypothetical protein
VDSSLFNTGDIIRRGTAIRRETHMLILPISGHVMASVALGLYQQESHSLTWLIKLGVADLCQKIQSFLCEVTHTRYYIILKEMDNSKKNPRTLLKDLLNLSYR